MSLSWDEKRSWLCCDSISIHPFITQRGLGPRSCDAADRFGRELDLVETVPRVPVHNQFSFVVFQHSRYLKGILPLEFLIIPAVLDAQR